jgi:nitrous oxide reductase accessory protein NosL
MDAMAASADALAKPEPVALTDEALANFSGWFCRNYPGPDTIIHKPEWHAPKVFRAAADALTRYGTPANTTNQVH